MKSPFLAGLLLGVLVAACAESESNDDASTSSGAGGTARGGDSGTGRGGASGSGTGGASGSSASGASGSGGTVPAVGTGGSISPAGGTGGGGTGGAPTAGTGGGGTGGAGGSIGGAGRGGGAGGAGAGGVAGAAAGAGGRGGGTGGGGVSGAGGRGGSASGGASGTGGNGTGGAAGTVGGCGVDPVTPNATQKARKVLCYLYQTYGNHILAGQEENNDDNAMNYISSNTGKSPAIRAFDVNNTMAPSQCVAHSRNNGLCVFGYHMGIVSGDGYQSSQTKTDINTLLTEGTTYNNTFKTRLDNVARMVQTVQDADGVAIMRLFHEAGGTWFWWSMEGGAQFVRVYKYAFNYLTATKGLKNMIWLMPYDGSPDGSFYPGKSFVDLGGADTYAGDGNYDPLNSLYKKCVAIFGSSMPIALHECGPIPEPAQLMSTGTKWLFFNVWTAPYYQSPSISLSHLQSVYTSSYVITRDEMPAL
jgi:Glycosyl hydrolase family 26